MQMLRSVTACLCAALLTTAAHAAPITREISKDRIAVKAQLKVIPFGLAEVRLLPGPFAHAQELDHAYLLHLDPERLLATFRTNAGLATTAKAYGGWEAPGSEVRGHFAGHYVSACAQMYAATGDVLMKQRAATMVAGMAECQAAMKSGYLSAYPESFIDRVVARQQVWAPWYTLHKVLAGLLDDYVYCDNRQALDVASRMGDWVCSRLARITPAQSEAMLDEEQGGMNEAMANLYALTGKAAYLTASERFNHHKVLDPLAKREDRLTGLHANTQIPKVIGAAREYELTGNPEMATISRFFWETVTRERSYVIGGHSDGEHFTPKEHLSEALGTNTTETCNTYNMLKLTRRLFTWDPQAEYADYAERALWNHILASQNPVTGMMCYYVPLRSNMRKGFNTPDDSFWCCTGTGVENHARYGESIYFHDGDRGLWVNQFIASTVNWRSRSVTVRQETTFPNEAATRLHFTCARPTRLALQVRHPFWCTEGFAVRVNGVDAGVASQPASFVTIDRTWKSGDTVEVSLPLALRTEAFKDNPHRFAFLYGPILLCGINPPGQTVPVVLAEPAQAQARLAAEGAPLRFRAEDALFRIPGQSASPRVEFAPFYSVYDQNYVVYWDSYNQATWDAKQKQVATERAAQAAIEARMIDVVHPGEEQNERDHKFKSQDSASGPYSGRIWRDARNGGWFEYQLDLKGQTPGLLACTYWGSDGGGRDFDILVDGVKIATESLNGSHPDRFFDVTYPIPAGVLANKQKITVRFQAHPGAMAGGVFGLGLMKSAPKAL